ncbi:uncharacterized protein [Amphiura filiformis]|uniref:uncharacterized protein n=1 Tax=Amphiura filiformis TaxID=82378 RepID=UPI003B21E023
MAKTLFFAVMLICLVGLLIPEPGWSCRVPVGDNTDVYPTYDPDTGAVGVGMEHRFKREAKAPAEDSHASKKTKKEVFTLLDVNGNKQIQLEEWVASAGTIDNFVEFLKDDDANGDAMISWEEFPEVKA